MKRILLGSLIFISILCSCSSLFETPDVQTSGARQYPEQSAPVQIYDAQPSPEQNDSPVYNAQTYPVLYTEEPLSKDGKVLVLCDSGDFMFQREVETSMVEAFSRNGITACAYSSIEYEPLPSYFDYLYAVALENDCRYILIAEVSEVYTYNLGGGIAQIRFDSNLGDYEDYVMPLRVSGAVNCEENIYHTFTESIEPAGRCLAEAIVEEYMNCVEFT